jgi:hypothetical protein
MDTMDQFILVTDFGIFWQLSLSLSIAILKHVMACWIAEFWSMGVCRADECALPEFEKKEHDGVSKQQEIL